MIMTRRSKSKIKQNPAADAANISSQGSTFATET
jgi:hypothetical protein